MAGHKKSRIWQDLRALRHNPVGAGLRLRQLRERCLDRGLSFGSALKEIGFSRATAYRHIALAELAESRLGSKAVAAAVQRGINPLAPQYEALTTKPPANVRRWLDAMVATPLRRSRVKVNPKEAMRRAIRAAQVAYDMQPAGERAAWLKSFIGRIRTIGQQARVRR